MINNLILVKLVIIVHCMNVFQSINSLNNLNAYFWELNYVSISSTNNALLLAKNVIWASDFVLNSMTNFLVCFRYLRIRLANFIWNLDELIRNSDNLKTTWVTFNRVITATKLIDLTRCWYAWVCWVVAIFWYFIRSAIWFSNLWLIEKSDESDVLSSRLILNLLINFFTYNSWDNQTFLVSLSRVMLILKNHFNSPRHFISKRLNNFIWNLFAWVLYRLSYSGTISCTKKNSSR
jgi:hypothetical protein